MSKHLVFVYGSLKRGFRNHRVISGGEFAGVATTVARFNMLDVRGAYPALVTDLIDRTKAGQILGELYNVDDDTLAALDKLEGYPDFYTRGLHPVVRAHDGETLQAIIYTLPLATAWQMATSARGGIGLFGAVRGKMAWTLDDER